MCTFCCSLLEKQKEVSSTDANKQEEVFDEIFNDCANGNVDQAISSLDNLENINSVDVKII